jgi:Fe-S cluster assembly protein SufD
MTDTTKEKNNLKESLIKEFTKFESHLNGSSSIALHDLRKDALNHFKTLGFPNRKEEEWKYTDIAPIIKHDFQQVFSKEKSDLIREDIEEFLIPGLNADTIVLVNGKYSDDLSNIKSDSKQLSICSFKEAQNNHSKIFNTHFSKYADYKTNGFTALNTAFAYDGVFIYVPDGNIIKEPVIILNISDTKIPHLFIQPRNLFVIGKNSSVTFLDFQYTIGDNDSFNNTVTEILTDKNSAVNLYKLQNESDKNFYVGTTQVHQKKDSKFNSVTISWGGKITRNNLNSLLIGEGCECSMDGAFILSGSQHVDNHTLVDHAVPNCLSNEFYKGILDDKSTGVFNGKIMVRKDAQKTNAYQTNNNILLTDTASMNSKPQLEIFADDVRCSHGTTTGQLNEDELFYLRTRGIDEKEAIVVLLFAFVSEIIQKVKLEPLMNKLLDMLSKKLKKDI